MNIGKKIKNLRKAQNLSQEKLAEHFNVTPQAVSKWENGTAYPDITIIPSLAVFLIFLLMNFLILTKPKLKVKLLRSLMKRINIDTTIRINRQLY